MTSRQVKELISSEKGIIELYKINQKYFDKIDECAELYTNADLLDEYQLSHSMDSITGCYAKLNPIAGALEALLEEYESNYQIQEEAKFETLRVQDQNSSKVKARAAASDIRRFLADFSRYCQSAQALVVTAQSRVKRLTTEKGLKRVDNTGEVPVNQKEEKSDVTW